MQAKKNLKTSEKLDLELGFKYEKNLDTEWKIRLYFTKDGHYMNSNKNQGYFALVPGRR